MPIKKQAEKPATTGAPASLFEPSDWPVTSFRISPEMKEALRVRAFEDNTKIGEVIRRAITAYLTKPPPKK